MDKRRISNFLMIVSLASLCLCACGSQSSFTVSFDDGYNGSQSYENLTKKKGEKLEMPDTPVREGYTFLGWYQDEARTQEWNFEKDKVKSDLTLFALWDKTTQDAFQNPDNEKDFSTLKTPGSQEQAYEYMTYFLPEIDGIKQPYVGDTMPYYEDGVYYIYYLKDGGDSYNHSIYLTTTTDFVTYTEQAEPVLEASRSGGQDSWIGTGSVVKVEETYYLFYTGHTMDTSAEYKEKIMVAKSDNLYSFEKIKNWEIIPDADLRQKNDFRDPQAYYDPETGMISLTITASQDNVAKIIKYSVKADLSESHYDGVIFTNTVDDFWNLECSDTFQIGDTWYITYSAQDDTLWYASSEHRYGPYSEAKRLEGKLFYAAKHVEDEENAYMVGWARRSESPSSTKEVSAWAGNLVVQKLVQTENGELTLAPVDAVSEQFDKRRDLLLEKAHLFAESGSLYSYYEVFQCYESFMLTGEFTYTGKGSFGLCFDYNGKPEQYKMISVSPEAKAVQMYLNEGSTLIAETMADLVPGEDYSFTYIQEGSVGVFYIDNVAALTVRMYGVSGKPIQLFVENNGVYFSSLRQYTR